ncbi:hypothetical protein P7K49_010436 [Saguinus oedipus]|uniref:Uncharacterized protein n=1 Tax=Saguinus oedipus TaxID=9490 RepID=A0ABQ9VMR8_SAGOE|nr:hypothetical protein P7K49_010436 [Saguinus oedipus]
MAGREERQEEEARPGEPPPQEEREEAERFMAHSLPARLTHSAKDAPGLCPDPQAAMDPGEEPRVPASALQPPWGPGSPLNVGRPGQRAGTEPPAAAQPPGSLWPQHPQLPPRGPGPPPLNRTPGPRTLNRAPGKVPTNQKMHIPAPAKRQHQAVPRTAGVWHESSNFG